MVIKYIRLIVYYIIKRRSRKPECIKGFRELPVWCEGSSPGIKDTALGVRINLRRTTCVKGSRGRVICDDFPNTGGTTQLQRPASISQDFFVFGDKM